MATNSANVKSDSTSATPEAAIKAETAPSTGKVPDAGAAANDEVYNQSANSKDDVCFVSNAGPDSLTTTVIIKPDAGEALSVQMAQGQKYFLDMYEKDVVSFDQQGENLKLVFADGSSILLVGYFTATSGDLASTMAFRDDFALEQAQAAEALPEQLVPDQAKADEKAEDVAKVESAAGDAESVAQQVAAIEPAAGEDAGQDVQNTGFTFRDPDITPVGPLAAIGPIDPTALNYGINFQSTPVRPLPQAAPAAIQDSGPELAPALAAVDETNLDPNSPIGARGEVIFDFGNDGPGTLTPSGTFTFSGSALNGQLTSCGEAVTVTATANGYVGMVGDRVVFELSINPDTGAFVFQQFGPLDHNDPNNPDDALNLVFGVRATDGDGDSAVTTITIRVNDDGPSVVDPDARTIDESDLDDGNIVIRDQLDVDFGGDGPGTVDGSGDFNFTGVSNLTSGGHPIVITQTANGYVGMLENTRQMAFEITINADGSYEFVQRFPLDHAPGSNTLSLQFGVRVTDCDGDSVTTQIVINITDSVPEIIGNGNPQIGVDLVVVDETNLPNGSTASGQLNIDYGADGPGSLTSNGTFSSSSPLTSGGHPITVMATDGGYIGTITVNGVTTMIFTLNISSSGAYTFTQNEQIDHPNPTDPNDPIRLNFGVTARDGDGDTANGTIRVDILDDGPVAVDDNATVLENTLVVDGNVLNNDDVGEDVTGLNGNGEVVSVTFNGQIYTVIPGGDDTVITGQYGTLTINSTGQYTYTSFGTNTSQVQDRFIYTIRDFDGDIDTAVLTVTIQDQDSTPIVATPRPLVVDETDLSPTDSDGSVISVDFGGDGPGSFAPTGTNTFSFSGQEGQALTSNGVPVIVTLVGNDYVGTANGVEVFKLTLNPSTGAYNFTLSGTLDHGNPNDPDDAITLNFGVTVRDADGDAVNTNVQVLVRDDGPVANADINNFSAQAQGKDFNVVMMLDVSGSMEGEKLALLKAAVANLFADLNDYTGGDVMVHLVPFSTDGQTSGTFNISTPEGYAAALAYLNALEAGGITNYEAPLQDAISWLQGDGPIDGADTYTYFVSDGAPNAYIDANGNWVFNSDDGVILGEITGSDGTNEIAILQGLSTEVIGVGIGVNSTTLNILDIIDSDGNALDVQDPNDLNAAFQGTIPLSGSTSGNVITGQNGGPGAGDDVGADGAVVTSVTFNGIVYAVHPVNGVTIQGLNGTLVMQANGSYTYALDRDATPVNGVIRDQFSYTLTDGDGDRSTGTLTLQAQVITPPPAPDVVDVHSIDVIDHPILVAHGVDHYHGEHDGEVIYGLPYQTQPVVKPVHSALSDDVVTRPIEKPVENSKPAIKPAIKPVDVIKDDVVEHGLPVEIQPVDVSKPFEAYNGKLKIDIIKDILDVQRDDVVLYSAGDKDTHDFAVELVEDAFLGIISNQKPFADDFGVQPFDEKFELPDDILDASSVLHGVDALQESINAFVISTSANDNHLVSAESVSAGHNVMLFASASSGVSSADLNDISEQAANAQGRI
jgi:T1SS-143 domain-containing protein